MLVLTRRIGEKIIIRDDIYLTVLDIKKGQVKIGIEAPKNVPVNRQEIYEKIKQEEGDILYDK